ncbi:MAG: amidohydrolase family protein, partial [Pseudomonadota bacterium]
WMATAGGAAALGLSGEIGTISAGKWADLTCVDLSALNSQPVYDPVSQLVYAARSNQVSDVWVAGRHRVEGGQLNDTDTASICARANEWRERIASAPS